MQRFFDVILSSLAMILLSPLLTPIAILLRFTGEGEVFFLQERVGKDGRLFKLYKFATMLKNSPNMGTGTITTKGDPRVLPIGRFLRKSKINELPQLLNILLGDMSVVGPRPQTLRCFKAFPPDLQSIIIKVKPGLSGIGPIVFRGEENILTSQLNTDFYDDVIAPYKGQVEAWYSINYNIKTYFIIILATIWVVLFPSSTVVWRWFKGLPTPPEILKKPLNFLNTTL